MPGLVTACVLFVTVFVPIVMTGTFMLPGIEDATDGTTANRPKRGPFLFFYLLGYRATRRLKRLIAAASS